MIELFPADKSDLKSFIHCFNNCSLQRNYFIDKEKITNNFNEFIGSKTILKAVQQGQNIGFLCYIPKGAFHSFPFLHLFIIDEPYRNKGFGTKILTLFENTMFKNNKLFLLAADFNESAINFYLKNGYRKVGLLPNLYRDGISEHLMMKVIK